MKNAEFFIEDINIQVEEFVNGLPRVRADKLGLDIRAGHRLYVTEDAVVCESDATRPLDYYGGFEYIDSQYRVAVGSYVFYLSGDDRVSDCLAEYTATLTDEQLKKLIQDEHIEVDDE